MDTVAKNHDKSVSQVALGWLLSQPVVTCPIIGPRTIDQLTDNLAPLDYDFNRKKFNIWIRQRYGKPDN
jgi:aryl-alcohol dehydrogenase-like predicted oxidoreductase